MIKFIGDLSSKDAEVLKKLALDYSNILEFGVGGSTQILSHYGKSVISIDTSEEWINKTKANIELLKIQNKVTFFDYDKFMDSKKDSYDCIFVDGLFALRRVFAIALWPYLKVGGAIAFHDTRRLSDVKNVSSLIETYFSEVGRVEFNYDHSNITIVEKKVSEPYINWNDK